MLSANFMGAVPGVGGLGGIPGTDLSYFCITSSPHRKRVCSISGVSAHVLEVPTYREGLWGKELRATPQPKEIPQVP